MVAFLLPILRNFDIMLTREIVSSARIGSVAVLPLVPLNALSGTP